MKKEMGDKGMSDVVTTVLIILFAIVAVAIIGGIVLNQVNKAGGKIDSSAICNEFQVTPVKCTAGTATTTAKLMIRRDSGGKGFSVSSIKAVFEDSNGAVVASEDVKAELSSDITSKEAEASANGIKAKAGIAVMLKDSTGKDIACDYYKTTKIDCV